MTTALRSLRTQSSSPLPLSLITRSDRLVTSSIRRGDEVRDFFLSHPEREPGPVLAVSPFVPIELAEHLMVAKRDSAIGSKWINRGDSITNMEGALHTWVTAILPVKMFGDYRFRGYHNVDPFPFIDGFKQYRPVLLSTAIHPDFENAEVMMALTVLGDEDVIGEPLENKFHLAKWDEKMNTTKRMAYEKQLRSHMVYHLTSQHRLPAYHPTECRIISLSDCPEYLETLIRSDDLPPAPLVNTFVRNRHGEVLSLEMLFNGYVASLVNEFSVLEMLCATGGYAYTFDPPSIFANTLDADVLNRLMILGLRAVAEANQLSKMRIFAFNDYRDKDGISLIREAMKSNPKVLVLSRSQLFSGVDGTLNTTSFPGMNGASLVIHNNSDGFGQNIETEMCSSLDGAVGTYSSAAAGLHRGRSDLVSCVV